MTSISLSKRTTAKRSWIAAIVVPIVVLLLILLFLWYWFLSRRRSKASLNSQSTTQPSNYNEKHPHNDSTNQTTSPTYPNQPSDLPHPPPQSASSPQRDYPRRTTTIKPLELNLDQEPLRGLASLDYSSPPSTDPDQRHSSDYPDLQLAHKGTYPAGLEEAAMSRGPTNVTSTSNRSIINKIKKRPSNVSGFRYEDMNSPKMTADVFYTSERLTDPTHDASSGSAAGSSSSPLRSLKNKLSSRKNSPERAATINTNGATALPAHRMPPVIQMEFPNPSFRSSSIYSSDGLNDALQQPPLHQQQPQTSSATPTAATSMSSARHDSVRSSSSDLASFRISRAQHLVPPLSRSSSGPHIVAGTGAVPPRISFNITRTSGLFSEYLDTSTAPAIPPGPSNSSVAQQGPPPKLHDTESSSSGYSGTNLAFMEEYGPIISKFNSASRVSSSPSPSAQVSRHPSRTSEYNVVLSPPVPVVAAASSTSLSKPAPPQSNNPFQLPPLSFAPTQPILEQEPSRAGVLWPTPSGTTYNSNPQQPGPIFGPQTHPSNYKTQSLAPPTFISATTLGFDALPYATVPSSSSPHNHPFTNFPIPNNLSSNSFATNSFASESAVSVVSVRNAPNLYDMTPPQATTSLPQNNPNLSSPFVLRSDPPRSEYQSAVSLGSVFAAHGAGYTLDPFAKSNGTTAEPMPQGSSSVHTPLQGLASERGVGQSDGTSSISVKSTSLRGAPLQSHQPLPQQPQFASGSPLVGSPRLPPTIPRPATTNSSPSFVQEPAPGSLFKLRTRPRGSPQDFAASSLEYPGADESETNLADDEAEDDEDEEEGQRVRPWPSAGPAPKQATQALAENVSPALSSSSMMAVITAAGIAATAARPGLLLRSVTGVGSSSGLVVSPAPAVSKTVSSPASMFYSTGFAANGSTSAAAAAAGMDAGMTSVSSRSLANAKTYPDSVQVTAVTTPVESEQASIVETAFEGDYVPATGPAASVAAPSTGGAAPAAAATTRGPVTRASSTASFFSSLSPGIVQDPFPGAFPTGAPAAAPAVGGPATDWLGKSASCSSPPPAVAAAPGSSGTTRGGGGQPRGSAQPHLPSLQAAAPGPAGLQPRASTLSIASVESMESSTGMLSERRASLVHRYSMASVASEKHMSGGGGGNIRGGSTMYLNATGSTTSTDTTGSGGAAGGGLGPAFQYTGTPVGSRAGATVAAQASFYSTRSGPDSEAGGGGAPGHVWRRLSSERFGGVAAGVAGESAGRSTPPVSTTSTPTTPPPLGGLRSSVGSSSASSGGGAGRRALSRETMRRINATKQLPPAPAAGGGDKQDATLGPGPQAAEQTFVTPNHTPPTPDSGVYAAGGDRSQGSSSGSSSRRRGGGGWPLMGAVKTSSGGGTVEATGEAVTPASTQPLSKTLSDDGRGEEDDLVPELAGHMPTRGVQYRPAFVHNEADEISALHQPSLPVAVYRAIKAYRPVLDDELELVAGDLVIILHEFDDGWCFARLVSVQSRIALRALEGICPRSYIQQHAESIY